MKVTAIFDIGRTNKKFFLFNTQYQQVLREYTHIQEIEDEDGFPCDDLSAIQEWMQITLNKAVDHEEYDVKSLNFSGYGASFVHIGRDGKPVTPIYNYLKPIPPEILTSFYQKYGDELSIAQATASPPLGMLNSGLQLYWLKYAKPEVFEQIRWSLHFPQYLSYVFSGVPLSEYTSIGCHTFLWDYAKGDYHGWVYEEGIDFILPPIVSTDMSVNLRLNGAQIKMGVGIHDSSSALLPYIKSNRKPFVLLSTGTWSICMNPFNQDNLSAKDLQQDCLNFLSIEGKSVKASRLFLGKEYRHQKEVLDRHYKKAGDYHQTVLFDPSIYQKLRQVPAHYFRFEYIELPRSQPPSTQLAAFASYEEAYHQLMMELTDMQIQAVERVMGETQIARIFVDGGFADNQIYTRLLVQHFSLIKLKKTQTPLGSALGAAMVLSSKEINPQVLKENFRMNKQKSKKMTN